MRCSATLAFILSSSPSNRFRGHDSDHVFFLVAVPLSIASPVPDHASTMAADVSAGESALLVGVQVMCHGPSANQLYRKVPTFASHLQGVLYASIQLVIPAINRSNIYNIYIYVP